jgi:ammonia channel protein AmtB
MYGYLFRKCSTLAGGVAIGAACDMITNPWGAMLTGTVAGAV